MTNRSSRTGIPPALFPTCLLATLVGLGVYFDRVAMSVAPDPAGTRGSVHGTRPTLSPDVLQIAQWVVASNDHAGLPFLVVDKAGARLFTFDASGRPGASAPVLLGASRGDDSSAPDTPAGRFVVDTWLSAQADGIVWVNETTSLALHELPSSRSPGRGMQRLASANADDKRISDGSLHVAQQFYRDNLVRLKTEPGVAYVLPELLPMDVVFSGAGPRPSLTVAQSARQRSIRRPS